MATYTPFTFEQASELLSAFGVEAVRVLPINAGSVNSNYRVRTHGPSDVFVRIYEEQDRLGAEAEARLLFHLARANVPTPCPLPRLDGRGFTKDHLSRGRSRPLAVFPWRTGDILCQRSITADIARQVGAELARTHLAALSFREKRPGRYRAEDLRSRLSTIAEAESSELRAMAPRILDKLDEAAARRNPELPGGIIHSDLFRDNVLWEDGRIVALLDFESACEGSFACDLMVTVLAWCYGDDLDLNLVRAMLAGYQSVRKLEPEEKTALAVEGRMAALRFTVTRITDMEMRAKPGEKPVKDWRRFWDRHARMMELGEAGMFTLLG